MRARRVGIATAAVLGVGLFGSSVHGLTRLDGRLAERQEREALPVMQERPAAGLRGCPWRYAREL
jgi:hypothetical protein